MRICIPVMALVVWLFVSCAGSYLDTGGASAGSNAPLSEGVSVTLQGFDGSYVSCELGAGGADRAILLANRATPGDWERFTLFPLPDGKIALQAANGKFVCADGDRGDSLVADRDSPGDREIFTVEPQEGGQVLLKTHEGSYVSADFALEGGHRGRLVGDRNEAHDQERFTIMLIGTGRP